MQVFNKIQGIELSKVASLDSGVTEEFWNQINQHETLKTD